MHDIYFLQSFQYASTYLTYENVIIFFFNFSFTGKTTFIVVVAVAIANAKRNLFALFI